MDLTTHQEEKLRRGLGAIVNEAPPGKDFDALAAPTVVSVSPKTRTGVWVAAATLVGVLILFSPLLLMSEPEPAIAPPEEPVVMAAPPTTVIEETVVTEPPIGGRFPVVVEIEGGDLIGLDRQHAFRSSDGGESWTEILVDSGADLIDLLPDGTVVAVRNSEEQEPLLGPASYIRTPPSLYRYDPSAGEWRTNELPLRAFPVDDPRPVPMDGSGNCPKGGIQQTSDALSMAVGDQLVLAGESRVTEFDICDKSFQFFWVSDDGGDSWTIIEETGIPGYIVSLTWFDGRYVAVGSDIVWYRSVPKRSLQVWSSTDLTVWEEAELDLSILPDNAVPSLFPDEEATFGLGNTVLTQADDGVLRFIVQIALALPAPPADLSSFDELLEWVEVNNRYPIDEYIFDSGGLTFPLDDDELQWLHNYFFGAERGGKLTLETSDGLTWTTHYDGS